MHFPEFYNSPPAASRCPPEIICIIFEYSVPDPPQHDSDLRDPSHRQYSSIPLTLGAICKHWRSIAWDTPLLWTTISIAIDNFNKPERVTLVEEWLARSRNLPLNIILHLRRPLDLPQDAYTPLLKAIAATSHRWRTMSMKLPWDLTQSLCEMAEELPMIHALRMDLFEGGSMATLDLYDVVLWGDERPAPAKLWLCGSLTPHMNVVWDALTTFEVRGITASDCSNVLRFATMLDSCTFYDVIEAYEGQDFNGTILHEKLRRLTYTTDKPERSKPDLFILLVLPGLTHFSYTAPKTAEESWIMHFFERSSCPLVELELIHLIIDYEADLSFILQTTPSITRLTLFPLIEGQDNPEEAYTAAPLVKDLAQESEENDSATILSTDFLPNLRYLEYRLSPNLSFPWTNVPKMFGHPTTLSNPDRRPFKTLKVLNADGDPSANMHLKAIPKDVLLTLIELRKAGIEIIYEDTNHPQMDLFALSLAFHSMTEKDQ
ncbi:hypothetical protein CPC08DRAFT_814372 [Agrocybe pediades]|nr:hypothetical protein CPC08DRAFT_814372 [Agrocybe pediades]